ncbi:MAG: DNA-binding protein [Verrucomicrobia bacterium]|nr:DNA-binding protein [Verrucomicrobiota bacterium]
MRNDEMEEPKRGNPPLHSEKIMTDRKIFFLDLKENDRGRVIKITEDVRGRRDTIMVPLEAAEEFLDALQRILEAERDLE